MVEVEAFEPSLLGVGDKGSCLGDVVLLMLPTSSDVDVNVALSGDAGPILRAMVVNSSWSFRPWRIVDI